MFKKLKNGVKFTAKVLAAIIVINVLTIVSCAVAVAIISNK